MSDDVNWISVPEDEEDDEPKASATADGSDPAGADAATDRNGGGPSATSGRSDHGSGIAAGDRDADDRDSGTGFDGESRETQTSTGSGTAGAGITSDEPRSGTELGAVESGRGADAASAEADDTADAGPVDDVEERVKKLIERQTREDADEDGAPDEPGPDAPGTTPPDESRDASPDESVADEPETSTTELRLAARSNGDGVDAPGDATGPTVEAVADPTSLRSVLTERRIELVESVMDEPPASIRGLADRLGRDVKDVHGDLHHLAEFGVVKFDENGRAKQPTVPYDRVTVEVGITPRATDE